MPFGIDITIPNGIMVPIVTNHRENEMKLKIIDASWHRNGVGGIGFFAILFDDAEQGRMIASLFDEDGMCAVYKVDELAKGNIAFACGNSWRGDRFESALRPLLAEFLKASGTNRLGPFGLPSAPRKTETGTDVPSATNE